MLHFVNFYRTCIAQRYQLQYRPDELIADHLGDPRSMEALQAYLDKHLTPEHLIQRIAKACRRTGRTSTGTW